MENSLLDVIQKAYSEHFYMDFILRQRLLFHQDLFMRQHVSCFASFSGACKFLPALRKLQGALAFLYYYPVLPLLLKHFASSSFASSSLPISSWEL